MKGQGYSAAILIYFLALMILGCDDFWGIDKKNDITESPDSTRFKELESPIEGKLLFVAGPSHFESDSIPYQTDPWDFYQLSGTTFKKLNDTPWFDNRGQVWNVKWSANGNYIAFYHDILITRNSDDIAVMNVNSMDVTYLTESLGDANTYDEAIYKWADDESFIYFTALPFGVSEQDDNISPDIYRASPDGTLLEQITDNDYYEAHANPSPDGSKIFYGIYPYHDTPDSVTGFYIYDLTTNTSKRIVTKEEIASIHHRYNFHVNQAVYWNPTGNYILVNPFYRGLLVKIDIELGITDIIDLKGNDFVYGEVIGHSSAVINYSHEVMFNLNNEDQAFIYGHGDDDFRWGDIYSVDLLTGASENLTSDLITLDNQYPVIESPTVSPSGNLIAFTAQLDYDTSEWLIDGIDGHISQNTINQKTNIYMIDLNTRELTRLTDGVDGWEGYLRWIE